MKTKNCLIYFLVSLSFISFIFSNELTFIKLQNFNKITFTDYKKFEPYWTDLFSISKIKACSSVRINSRINTDINRRRLGRKKEFWWIKKWGYQAVSYLFDFLDPVLREPIVKEFQRIYDAIKVIPTISNDFDDPFDYLNKVKKIQYQKLKKRLFLFKKYYNKEIYNLSLTSPQINEGFKRFNWPRRTYDSTEIKNYIFKYDLNYDGRLNPREMILATIYDKPYYIGSGNCEYCYKSIANIIKAIFLYLDCNEDGFLSAQEIWNTLPSIKRNTSKFDIFQFGNDESIRTAAVNDFILKNMKVREAYVNQEEFRSGILLGIWDRQTEKDQILIDDLRNLKNLRWKEDDMIDIKNFEYYKELEIKKDRSN